MIKLTIGALATVAALAAGCANGPNDTLTGRWTNTSCFGATAMPADIQSCSISLTFAADLSVTLVDTRQSQPATAVYPRCTTTRRVVGPQYSTSNSGATIVTIAGPSTSTVERSGCANETDNTAAIADTVNTIPVGAIAYTLSGSALTFSSGPLRGTYTRALL
jgi:hypothetical protein